MLFNRRGRSFGGCLSEKYAAAQQNRNDTKSYNCWKKIPHAFYSAGIRGWNDTAYHPMSAMCDDMLDQVCAQFSLESALLQ